MTATPANPTERTCAYLSDLSPKARNSLLNEIERKQLYGEDITHFAPILTRLRAEFRRGGEGGERIGNPSRHFFKPIESLFVDRPPETTSAGQISRGSLAPIWEWISHDFLPAMTHDYCEAIRPALAAGRSEEADGIAGSFHSKVVKSLEATFASEECVRSARRGLGQYTTCRLIMGDLRKVLSALQIREAMVAINRTLPAMTERLDDAVMAKTNALLDEFSAKDPDVLALPFALTAVAKRLRRPWQIVLLAERRGDKAAVAHAATLALDHLDDRRRAGGRTVEAAKTAEIREAVQALLAPIGRLGNLELIGRLDGLTAALGDGDAVPERERAA